MSNKKKGHSVTKVLALALALILALGNLPLMSYAEEVGAASSSKPPSPQGEPAYSYQHKVHYYFATDKVGEDVLQYPAGEGKWWPGSGTTVLGTMYSNNLNLRIDTDVSPTEDIEAHDGLGLKTSTHYPASFKRFADIQLKLSYQEGGVQKETDYFPATEEGLNRAEIKEAFSKTIKSSTDGKISIVDQDTNETVIITPEAIKTDQYKIRPMRYVKYISNQGLQNEYRRIHLDLFITREKAKDITVEEYFDSSLETTTVKPGNHGTVLQLNQHDGKFIETVEVYVDGSPVQTYQLTTGSTVEDQLKENPIVYGDKAKTVKVKYGIEKSEGIEIVAHHMEELPLIEDQDETIELKDRNIDVKLLEQYQFHAHIKYVDAEGNETVVNKIEAKKPGTVDKIKIEAYTLDGDQIEVQKVVLLQDGKVVDKYLDSDKEVYSVTHEKGKKTSLLVYYKKRNLNPEPKPVDIVIYEERPSDKAGEYLIQEKVDEQQAHGTEHVIEIKDKAGYSIEGVYLDGARLETVLSGDKKTVRINPTKAKHEVVIKYIPAIFNAISKVKVYESLGQGESLRDVHEVPEGEMDRVKPVIKPGYKVEAVFIDGVKQDGIDKVDFRAVKPEHKVLIKYIPAISKVKVYESLGQGESLRDVHEVPDGEMDRVKPVIKPGYKVEAVFIDGVKQDGIDKVDFRAVKPEHKVLIKYLKDAENSGNAGNTGNSGNTGSTGNAGNTGNTVNLVTTAGTGYTASHEEYKPVTNDKADQKIIVDDETPLGSLNTNDYIAYIQGYPDGSVRSAAYVNREETAAIFFRLLEPNYRNSIRSEENNFKDVSAVNWSNKHISTLAKGGILNGYESGDFRPFDAITRAELAVIAAKFDKVESQASHNFTDIKGHWAEKYVANAAAKGWIKGYPNREFRPDMPITRAEFVTFVNKVLGRSVKKAEVLPGVRHFTDLKADAWYYEAMVTATNSYLAGRGDDGYQKWTELIKPVIEM